MAVLLEIGWLDRILGATYPPLIERWALPLIVGLLSLSLPLLVTNIRNFESEYRKRGVGKIIITDWRIIFYFVSIALMLVALVVYFMQIPFSYDWGDTLNTIMPYSAVIFVIIALFLLLVGVGLVVYLFLKHTINTRSVYQLCSKKLMCYFKKTAKNQRNGKLTRKKEHQLANRYRLDAIFTVIETAILECDASFFNEICVDLKNGIALYRSEYLSSPSDTRHALIEYPISFLCHIIDMGKACFAKDKIDLQQQIYSIISIVFFEIPEPDNFDVPKNGLSANSLEVLWSLLIDASNKKQTEYMRLYWEIVYEYTKRMFYAPVVTEKEKKDLPKKYTKYNLEEKDTFEIALIAYVHFMWQAYLYNIKDYETLQKILEYYNGVKGVPELNFLSIDIALLTYSLAPISKNKIAAINNMAIADNIYKRYPYYSSSATSEIDNQREVIAKYTSLLVHYHFNRWNEVPICSRNIINLSTREASLLNYALKNQQQLPHFRINEVPIDSCMTDTEIESFFMSIKQRNDKDEYTFIKKTDISAFNKQELFVDIKSSLSFVFCQNDYIWTNPISMPHEGLTDIDKPEITTSVVMPKNILLYTNMVSEVYGIANKVSEECVSDINAKITELCYATKKRVHKETVLAADFVSIISKMADEKRVILFCANDDIPQKMADILNWNNNTHVMSLSPRDGNSRKCIKYVRLTDKTSIKALENQLWVIQKDDQPKIRFVEPDNVEGWNSIHESTKKSFAIMDAIDKRFLEMPLYTQFAEAPDVQSQPMITLAIKGRFEIRRKDKINVEVFRIAELEQQLSPNKKKKLDRNN